MVVHILPNIMSPFLVVASFQVAALIIAESSLSFLGIGIPVGTPTWGGMLSDGREYLTDAWWVALFPGLAIMLTALSFNFLGDGLRDAFDPALSPRKSIKKSTALRSRLWHRRPAPVVEHA
jgi:peptide/nickel transport system permease protein